MELKIAGDELPCLLVPISRPGFGEGGTSSFLVVGITAGGVDGLLVLQQQHPESLEKGSAPLCGWFPYGAEGVGMVSELWGFVLIVEVASLGPG